MISSEENPDSKSVHLQQNSQNDAADNQIDYQTDVEVLPAESTVVDYEDRLSGDISDGTWHSALDDAASDEVMKKATFFVKTFVRKFEEELSKFSKEAKPDSKVRKAGKITGALDPVMKSAVRPGTDLPDYESIGGQLWPVLLKKGIDFCLEERHRKRAKRVSAAIEPLEGKVREILVDAGLEIFQSFEEQLTKIVDTGQLSWKRGIEKLAIDAASRVINYISTSNEKGEFPVPEITKGVVLGKSKTDTFAKQVLHKPAKFFKLEGFQPGYQVKDKQSDKALITSELYGKVGIKK